MLKRCQKAICFGVVYWTRGRGGSISRCGKITRFFSVPWPHKCSLRWLYSEEKEMTYRKWLIFTRSQTTILKATENWLFLAFLWLDKNSQRWLYSYKKNITYFNWKILKRSHTTVCFLGSIVVSIHACHAGDRGSIPRRGEIRSLLLLLAILNNRKWLNLSEKFKKEFRQPSVSSVV